MSKKTIAVFVGSLRKDSFNRKLANALIRLGPETLTFKVMEMGDLPLYSEEDDANQAPAVRRLKAEVEAADGLIFVTPEYNRSIPGVLKNAIDHVSRPWGGNSWSGKPAGMLGISVGPMGTALAQQHLRGVLAVLNVPLMAQPEVYLQASDGLFTASGDISEPGRAGLQGWMDRYVDWIGRFA